MADRHLYELDRDGRATDTLDPAAAAVARSGAVAFALWGGEPCRLVAGVLQTRNGSGAWRAIGDGEEHAPHRAALAEILAARAPDGEYELVGPGAATDEDYGLDRPQLWRVEAVSVPDAPSDDRIRGFLRARRLAGVAWRGNGQGADRAVAMRRAWHGPLRPEGEDGRA